MIGLTLRTLLAYLDDTLPPADAKVIGQKLAENEEARQLADRIRVLVRKRSLSTPTAGAEGGPTDPNTVAAYLSDRLSADQVKKFETFSLESDVSLAELAACHQILTLLLSDQIRVPPSAYKRMYGLVKGKEAIPGRSPSKQSMAVGGVNPTEKATEADEADAAYLLGMPAYSKDEPVGRKLLRWGVAGLLACGFVVAAGLAWLTLPAKPTEPTDNTVAKDTTPTTTPTKTEPTKPAGTPSTEPKKEDPPKVDPMPEEPKKVDPKPEEPKKEELGGKQPPNENRGAVAVNDSSDEQVLVVKRADADGWERVKKGAEVQATDRLVCLPGYRGKLQLKNGITTELWANVPGELLPLPFAETAVTAYLPADKIDADFTVHTGRVYVGSTLDRPAVVRLRVRDTKYPAKDLQLDLTLPDKGCEVVVEVQHALTPGGANEAARTVTVLHTLKGTATLPLKGKATTLAAGEVLVFNSVLGTADGQQKADEKSARGLAYFTREPVFDDPVKSRAMLKALRAIADRMKDAKSIPGVVAEQRTDPTAPPPDGPAFFAGAMWSVFASAALGDVAELADLLNDPNRQPIRTASFAALRGLLASSPEKIDAIRTTARDRWRLTAENTDAFLDTLAGVAEKKRTDADVLNKLADQLNAETIAQREAALFVLLTEVDPSAQKVPLLAVNVAGPDDKRALAVAGWKKRIAELVKEKK